MQPRQSLPARGAAIRGVGQREAFIVVELRDDRVQLRIHSANAREMRGHDLACGHLLRLDEPRKLGRVEVAQIRRRLSGGRKSAARSAYGSYRSSRRDELAPAKVVFVCHRLLRLPRDICATERQNTSSPRNSGDAMSRHSSVISSFAVAWAIAIAGSALAQAAAQAP